MNAKEKYLALKLERQAIESKIQEQCQEAFGEMCKDIFIKYPDILAFRWRQYTPYFNDGDHCTFSVNNDTSVKFIGSDIVKSGNEDDEYDEDEDNEGFVDSYDFNYSRGKDSPYDMISSLLDEFYSELEHLFGDGVEITVYPDRVETEEYSHD